MPTIICTSPWRVTDVTPQKDYQLHVKFVDGTYGLVDMKRLILGQYAGVFAKLRDIQQFKKVTVVYGVVTWPEEIDLAPDSMYDEIKQHGKWTLK